MAYLLCRGNALPHPVSRGTDCLPHALVSSSSILAGRPSFFFFCVPQFAYPFPSNKLVVISTIRLGPLAHERSDKLLPHARHDG